MSTSARPKRPRRCPICAKAVPPGGRTFCSERCQQIDLGRWLTGSYAIPAVEEEPPEPDEAA